MSPISVTRRVVIVLNPAAGRGRARTELARFLEMLASLRGDAQVEWTVRETAGPGDGTAIAAAATRDAVDIVAAAGGDGTCCEVARSLAGTHTALAVIPIGTGNDYARTLGVNSLGDAARALLFGGIRTVDCADFNGLTWINVAGCGFDAVVAERVNRGFRWCRGTAAYVAALLVCLVRLRPAQFTITVDGSVYRHSAMLCSIANARYYGGGMLIAPTADIADGELDVVVLKALPVLRFILAFPRVFKGTHISHPAVVTYRGRVIDVDAEPAMPVFVDGECSGRTPGRFAARAAALDVLFPPPKL